MVAGWWIVVGCWTPGVEVDELNLQRSRVADCLMVNDVVALTEPGPKSGERPGWAGWAQEGPWQIGWHSFPTSQEGS